MIQSRKSHVRRERVVSRRRFLAGTAAVAAFSIVPRHVLGGPNYVAPSDKIRMAIVGCGSRGGAIGNLFGQKEQTRIVALCDVAMENGRTKKIREKYPDARQFQDFRQLIDKMEDDIDACSIGVPDHAHFWIAMLAMSKGKHVYVEKPLANTYEECQLLIEAEKKYGVACQMGNQGHSGNNPMQFKTWVEQGVIKNVKRIDAFMNNKRRWHGWKIDGYPAGQPAPDWIDWDVWTGPAEMHPYDKRLDGGNWRCWYVYGNGAFGDWGPHILDTAHRYLELGLPTEIEAVKREGPNDYIFPQASTIAFRFPARKNMPPCEVTWYDGKTNYAPHPPDLEPERNLKKPGKVIYGEGLTFHGGSHNAVVRIVPESKMKERAATLPRWPRQSDHFTNFLRACRGEEKTHSPFRIGGELTQVFMLGVIAQRYGGTIKFDPKTGRITNNDLADKMLRTPPRKGWEQYYKL